MIPKRHPSCFADLTFFCQRSDYAALRLHPLCPCTSREPFLIFHSTDQKYCSSDRIVLWDTSVPNNPVRAALLQAFSRVDMSVFHWQLPWRIMGSHKLQLHAQRSIPNHPDKRDAQAQCFSSLALLLDERQSFRIFTTCIRKQMQDVRL